MEQNSEQELKQLLDDNKITQAEYEQLLSAMKEKPKVQTPPPAAIPATPKPPKKGLGRAALILFIVFFVLPVISIPFSALVPGKILALCGLPVFLCGLLAFIFGIIAWKTTPGKIAAIGVPVVYILILPVLILASLFFIRHKMAVDRERQAIQQKIMVDRIRQAELQESPAAVIKSEMVLVPAGVYKADGTTDQFVDAYMIDKYEVTNAQYCEFLNDADPTAQYWSDGMEIARSVGSNGYSYTVKAGRENYPIRYVSYDDAQAYADWKSQKTGKKYHLPDKFQWQKAAGWDPVQQKLWKYGFQSDTINSMWCNYDNVYGKPLSVGYLNGTGGKKDAKSYYGCYDMSGNVWEWTNEISDSNRVLRGGYWGDAATYCTVTYAGGTSPTYRDFSVGFRLVLDLN